MFQWPEASFVLDIHLIYGVFFGGVSAVKRYFFILIFPARCEFGAVGFFVAAACQDFSGVGA